MEDFYPVAENSIIDIFILMETLKPKHALPLLAAVCVTCAGQNSGIKSKVICARTLSTAQCEEASRIARCNKGVRIIRGEIARGTASFRALSRGTGDCHALEETREHIKAILREIYEDPPSTSCREDAFNLYHRFSQEVDAVCMPRDMARARDACRIVYTRIRTIGSEAMAAAKVLHECDDAYDYLNDIRDRLEEDGFQGACRFAGMMDTFDAARAQHTAFREYVDGICKK